MFFKKNICPVCDIKTKETLVAELRLETSEGLHILKVCKDCSDFFEKSAEVLSKGKDDEFVETMGEDFRE